MEIYVWNSLLWDVWVKIADNPVSKNKMQFRESRWSGCALLKPEKIVMYLCIAGILLISGCLMQPIGSQTGATSSVAHATQVDQDKENSTITTNSIVVHDHQGRVIQLSAPAQRIVVTNTDVAKTLMILGAQNQIVGISESIKKNPLTSVLNKSSVGEYSVPDPEKIIALHPDLVIFYSSDSPRNLDLLEQANITYAFFDCYKVDSLNDDIQALGVLTGKQERAAEFIAFTNNVMDTIKNRTKSLSPEKIQRVYYETGSEYTAAGTDSGGDLLIRSAGGENVAGITGTQWPKVNPEWVVTQNPDVIIRIASSDSSGDILKAVVEETKQRPGFQNISAVKNNRVYAISANLLYGPSSVVSISYIAKILYPNQFTDLDPNQILMEYSTRFFPEADREKIVYPDV